MFKNQHIIKRGSLSEGIYIVHSGEVDFLYSDKPRIPLITVGPSGVIGDNFMLGEPELMTSSVRSDECILLYIPLAYLLEKTKDESIRKQVQLRFNRFSLAKMIIHKAELVEFLTIVNSILSLIEKHRPQFKEWKGCSRKALQSILTEVEFEIQDYLSYDHEFDTRLQPLVTQAVHFNIFRFVNEDSSSKNLHDPRLPVADHEMIASEMNSRVEIKPSRQFKNSKLGHKMYQDPDELFEIQTQRQRRIVSLIQKSDAPTRKEASMDHDPMITAFPSLKPKKKINKQMSKKPKVPATFTFGKPREEPKFQGPNCNLLGQGYLKKTGAGSPSKQSDRMDSIDCLLTPRSNSAPFLERAVRQSTHKRFQSDPTIQGIKPSDGLYQRSQSALDRVRLIQKKERPADDYSVPFREFGSLRFNSFVPRAKQLSPKPQRKDSKIETDWLAEEPEHKIPRVKNLANFNRFKKMNSIELARGQASAEKPLNSTLIPEGQTRPKNSLLNLVATPGRLSTAPGSQQLIDFSQNVQTKIELQNDGLKTALPIIENEQNPTKETEANSQKQVIRPPKGSRNQHTQSLRNKTKVLCTIIKSGLVGPIEADSAALPLLLDPTVVNVPKLTSLEPNELFTKVAKELLALHCVRGNKFGKCRNSMTKKRKNRNRYLAILDEKEEDALGLYGALRPNDGLLAAEEYQNLDPGREFHTFEASDKESVYSSWHGDIPYLEQADINPNNVGASTQPAQPPKNPRNSMTDQPTSISNPMEEIFNTEARFSLVKRRCKVITARIAKDLAELNILLDRIEKLQQ